MLAASASAHDPFEVTSDAHVDAASLNVHTTLSLDTAVRLCLAEAAPARRLSRVDFPLFREQLERCARDYFAVTSGHEPLPVRSLSLELSREDDLEVRIVHERPEKSPLSFAAQGLKVLPEAGGIVLTVTGERSFLGQKVLRSDDTRLDLPITKEAEAIGASPLPAFGGTLPTSGGALPRGHEQSRRSLLVALLVVLVSVGVLGFVAVHRRRSRARY